MDVNTKIILFLVIAIVSVTPSLVAFFEMKKRDGIVKRILLISGIVFIPTNIIFSGLSILAQTNDGFTIMSLTWFSIIIFVLCELAVY